jgi:hypothetical protein
MIEIGVNKAIQPLDFSKYLRYIFIKQSQKMGQNTLKQNDLSIEDIAFEQIIQYIQAEHQTSFEEFIQTRIEQNEKANEKNNILNWSARKIIDFVEVAWDLHVITVAERSTYEEIFETEITDAEWRQFLDYSFASDFPRARKRVINYWKRWTAEKGRRKWDSDYDLSD